MEPLMRFGFFGLIAGNAIVIAIIATLVFLFMRRVKSGAKNLLLTSCVIAALLFIGFSVFLIRQLVVSIIVNQIVGGVCAYYLLRILFKREISEPQDMNQELTEGE
jgi:CHASE2 domain-containing sensor protein